jgi:hypothetical protein
MKLETFQEYLCWEAVGAEKKSGAVNWEKIQLNLLQFTSFSFKVISASTNLVLEIRTVLLKEINDQGIDFYFVWNHEVF